MRALVPGTTNPVSHSTFVPRHFNAVLVAGTRYQNLVREAVGAKRRVDRPEPLHAAIVISAKEDDRIHPRESLVNISGQQVNRAPMRFARHSSHLE